ncbi:hypothetical protein DIPPA_06284 [Diplonema papillatum]|nr:hypothetical protein DIPPA_06284 [Diplonema papillatum]
MVPDVAVATEVCGFSLAHGAGREQSRSDALAKGLKSRVTAESLTHTDLSSVVVCNDETLLYERGAHRIQAHLSRPHLQNGDAKIAKRAVFEQIPKSK